MDEIQLGKLLSELLERSNENEWIEYKLNFHSVEEIGERISALSNGACIAGQSYGYLVFGIEDSTYSIKGTTFQPKYKKVKGNEDLEHWLVTRLAPRIDFSIFEFDFNGLPIVIFAIAATKCTPVKFLHKSYIRIGSITRLLDEFPDKESKIWKKDNVPFEKEVAMDNLNASDVVSLLSSEIYFDLLNLPVPTTQQGIIDRFLHERLIIKNPTTYSITNLGALLFAKNLNQFEKLVRKSIRVIVYKGKSRVETEREQLGIKGYALGFEGLVDWVNGQLPANEEIGKALRRETRMYPEIAIRELIANALIHQDLTEKGWPLIEIFSDRIEISNPGSPMVSPERFIDSNCTRNDLLANLMRRMGICEEKGSGLDKVVHFIELYQLPPINIRVAERKTIVSIYSYKKINNLIKQEKIDACYQHSCLKYVSNDKMTNQSLRERFSIEDKDSSIASRIIKDTIESGKIKEEDPKNKSRKYTGYIPFWA